MDLPTIGVLHDVTLLVCFASVFGVVAFKMLRPASELCSTGQVDARSFIGADVLVVGAVAIMLLAGLSEVTPPAVPDKALEMTVNAGLAGIVVQLGLCTLLLVYLNVIRGLNLADLFGLRKLSLPKVLLLGVAFILPTFPCVAGAVYGMQAWMQDFWPDMSNQDTVEAFRACKDPLAKALLVVSAAIVAPLVEETIFRGFFYGVMKRYTDGYFAAICTSLLFAVVHLHIGTLMPLMILALILCAVYEFTGSLLVPMVMHGLFNGTSLAVMLLFPDMK